MFGKIGVQRPLLRSFRRLAGLRYRHQDWPNALRPLTSIHALLPLALKLGQHARELISIAYRGLRVLGHRSPSLRLAMVLVASQVAHADAKSCRPTQYPKAPMWRFRATLPAALTTQPSQSGRIEARIGLR